MRAFIASLAAAIALMAVLASPSLATTDDHFPEGVTAPACAVLGGNEAVLTSPPVMPATANNPPNAAGFDGSDNGYYNKVDLFTDACIG